jgi:thiamine-monophosphate kinase
VSAERASGSGEEDLIARYFRPLAIEPGAFGLIDDAAVLAGRGDDIVVTTDAVVAGVHFLPEDPPEAVARKALRVNLSDLAAKGASPAGFVLTLALPRADAAWLGPFARALGEDIATYRCPLLGGDTVSTPGPVTISITAFGRVPTGTMVRRAGARPGDYVAVSGSIGDATLGLRLLKGGTAAGLLPEAARRLLVARYREPQPRLALAAALRGCASAAMDVSDGLAGDLGKLCAASDVTATVALDKIPVSEAARAALAAEVADIDALITGGDDYEILCTVPPARWGDFVRRAAKAGVAATVIGAIDAGRGPPRFLDAGGRETVLPRRSFSHF